MALAPLILEPREVEAIWGGDALAERYGKPADPAAKIGESWECWDDNRIAAGAYAGRSVAELRAQLGSALLGSLDPSRRFPILTKFIDARAPLSVQVHPGDAYARRVEGEPNGKTECWYVLEAEAGATIVLGWNRNTTRAEYLERVRDGSLGDLLRRVSVRAGDVFYLPAGTLHAIGAGIVIYETQQASDLTYRIFDYNRLGPDGKPRTLHVEKAADVLDYRKSDALAIRSLEYVLDGLCRTALVADPHFIVERVALATELQGLDLEGMPLIVTALDRPVELEARGARVELRAYQTALVPAELDVLMARGLAAGARILAVAPPRDRDALPARLARAAVPVQQATDFVAQF